SPTATPFWWFDPVKNAGHLVLGLAALAFAFAPRLSAAIAGYYRVVTIFYAAILILAAGLGFAVAGSPSPHVFRFSDFENPRDNVIHLIIGVDCLWVTVYRLARQVQAMPFAAS